MDAAIDGFAWLCDFPGFLISLIKCCIESGVIPIFRYVTDILLHFYEVQMPRQAGVEARLSDNHRRRESCFTMRNET